MSWIFKDAKDKPPGDPKSARSRAALFSLPFVMMGLLALILLLHDGLLGGLSREKAIKLVSVIVVAGGFVALIFGIAAKKSSLASSLKSPLSENSENPWLKRVDWAAGRIKSTGIPDAKSSLVMGVTLCVLGGLIAALVLPKALRDGNYSALVVVIFPLIGTVFLAVVVRKILAHRRFGDCFFEMAQTPAPIGGALKGVIQTGARLEWEHDLQLKLLCVRRTISGAGPNRRTDETILWQEGKCFKSRADLPESESSGGIPVHFNLPAGQPECSERGTETICWRLTATAKADGAEFRATFDVPVFKVADAAAIPNTGRDCN